MEWSKNQRFITPISLFSPYLCLSCEKSLCLFMYVVNNSSSRFFTFNSPSQIFHLDRQHHHHHLLKQKEQTMIIHTTKSWGTHCEKKGKKIFKINATKEESRCIFSVSASFIPSLTLCPFPHYPHHRGPFLSLTDYPEQH